MTIKRSLNWALMLIIVVMLTKCKSTDYDPQEKFNSLVSDFVTPTEQNTLWCYWYWIADDISKEGITKDLEAMKAAGIGAALIGNINPDEIDGPVPILSEDWWEHMVHAVNEGNRLGVDIGAFNCPGWSMSGGPWIKSEKAMRHMVYSETSVLGGKKISMQLKKPTSVFQDVYVVAFPKISSEAIVLDNSNAKVTTQPAIKNANALIDGNTNSAVLFSDKEHIINFELTQEFTARSITLYPGAYHMIVDCKLQAWVNGSYKTMKEFEFDRRGFEGKTGVHAMGPLAIALPQTKAKKFKLICNNIRNRASFNNPKNARTGFSEIILSEKVVLENYLGKTMGRMHPTPQPTADSYVWNTVSYGEYPEEVIQPETAINLSDKIDGNGNLNWNAPEGEWTIMRFGMTPTGIKNHPAAPQGKGYEVDKANSEYARYHFNNYIGELLKRIPKESKSAFKYVIADSYETGPQNWTDNYAKKFEQRYGYDPKPFLPVFSGRVVKSTTASDRFLWDLRRMVADDVAHEYVGGLRAIAKEHGLKTWLENYGHWGFPSEFLMYGGQSDLISGEYWNEGTLGDIECKAATSAAHIYGKKTTSAECFTAGHRSFVRHPALLKRRGDWSLTEGINHHVLHLYIHQPDSEKVPGKNAWFSTEFNRQNTWFEQGKTYFDYLRRAQHLLQQGNYAADLCYFIGEDAPIMTGATNPAVPNGYSFDYINAEVIMNRMTVKDGRFVLPDGMNYGMLVLPPLETMRPELLAKIESLVAAGGKIYGHAPKTSPSLQNYPQSDDKVKALAAKLWEGDKKIKSYGKGVVIVDLPLGEALQKFDIQKDVTVSDEVLWTHRELNNMDIYFLTNQSGKDIEINPSFRIAGLQPQLWDAVTGEIKELTEYNIADGRTNIPLKMEIDRSWFVVFTNDSNECISKATTQNTPEYKTVQTVNSPWYIDFENKAIAPKPLTIKKLIDWSKSENDLLKYYSGKANYSTTFNYSKSTEKEVYLDLGEVNVMATVSLNGKEIGTVWMSPYRLNITHALQEGENKLSIKVVNVWRNRLTGDKSLAKEARTTAVVFDKVEPEEAIVASGLVGPVTIQLVK